MGGAFTESTCYNILSVDKDISKDILDEYFLPNNLNYSICRLPIGSSDFSINSYSYCTNKTLNDFSINRDLKYIIPVVKMAQNRNMKLKFLSSPWSPPAFMKDNNNLYNGGHLLPEYKRIWSNYLLKYIKAYLKENINIDFMTIQNEPNANQIWESCLYSSEDEMDLLTKYIYPLFIDNNIKTKLLIWDHNKEELFNRALSSLKTIKAIEEVSGIAFHWYSGDHFENIELLRKLFTNKLLIHTEGCTRLFTF